MASDKAGVGRRGLLTVAGLSALLAAKMSGAWLAFARTGNPNHPGLPHWRTVTRAALSNMVFDRMPRVEMISGDPE